MIEQNVSWNDDIGEWQLRCVAYSGNNMRKQSPQPDKDKEKVSVYRLGVYPSTVFIIDSLFIIWQGRGSEEILMQCCSDALSIEPILTLLWQFYDKSRFFLWLWILVWSPLHVQITLKLYGCFTVYSSRPQQCIPSLHSRDGRESNGESHATQILQVSSTKVQSTQVKPTQKFQKVSISHLHNS